MHSGNKALFCQLLGDFLQDMTQSVVEFGPTDCIFSCAGKFWSVMEHLVDRFLRAGDLSDDVTAFVGDGALTITEGG